MSSGISTSADQAGHGSPFLSFSTIFNNAIVPDELSELMDTTHDEQEKFSVKSGDVFLTRTSETLNELAMSSVALKDYPRATFSGFAKRLRPLNQAYPYPKYMAFYFRAPFFRKTIENMTTMTTRASLNEDLFGLLEVQVANFEQQKLIGDYLEKINRLQILNREANDNLLDCLRTLYCYWFIQFEFPGIDGAPYKSSGGDMVFSEDLGSMIPKGWSVANIVDNPLCDVIMPGVERFETKRYYATADIIGMDIGSGSEIDYQSRESRANMQPRPNSVWFAKMKDSVKHLFLCDSMSRIIEDSILSTGFLGLDCKTDAFEYVAAFISGPYFEKAKDQYANGATQQAVGNTELEGVKLVVPDKNTLKKFHKTAKPIIEAIGANIMESKGLENLQDWLLPMLMNGQATIA